MQSLVWALFVFCTVFSMLTNLAWRALAEPPVVHRDLVADTQADPAKQYAHWSSLPFNVNVDHGTTDPSENLMPGTCV